MGTGQSHEENSGRKSSVVDGGKLGVQGENAKKIFGDSSDLDKKVVEAIKKAKELEDKEGNHVPFTRIILKFPMIREAFTSLHLCFHEYDVDKNGTMDHSELREAMSRLTGVEMPEDEAIELFNSGDMYDDGKISFKEFIVCLAIGYVLKTVIVKDLPMEEMHANSKVSDNNDNNNNDEGKKMASSEEEEVETTTAEGKKNAVSDEGKQNERRKSVRLGIKLSQGGRRPSFMEGRGKELQNAFHLVMDAYLEFDRDAKGYCSREELAGTIAAWGGKSPSKGSAGKVPKYKNAIGPVTQFLTQERMDELDWDKNGYITFKEFAFAFLSWVGVDEKEDAF